ncbi:MAG: hypothetical protein LBJ47_00580 [Tannerella sp.]|nr:hypothetical protein [Tannerella sp.]
MNRIAVTGLENRGNLLVTKALSIMFGYDLCVSPSYSQIAGRYGLSADIEACQWPDSYVYCMGALMERVITEQRYGENFVSDGSVLKEAAWLKRRYPQVELIYEQSMIHSLERIIAEYASKKYDYIFHLSVPDGTETPEASCIRQMFEAYRIKHIPVISSGNVDALQIMAEHLDVKPELPAAVALTKAARGWESR